MTNQKETGYRVHLRAEFERRQRTNPRYSLRSFARALDLSPAFLAKVMNSQKGLSSETALKICQKLQFSASETAHFCRLVEIDQKSDAVKAALTYRDGAEEATPDEIVILKSEVFQVISDWYHFAIRELLETKGFRPDFGWIAQRLNISETEAKDAFERMTRLGLIQKAKGMFVKSESFIATTSGQPSRALRNHHAQMIEKAKVALEEQEIEERSISGVTIPISEDKLDLAKEEIVKFRRKMLKIMESSSPTEVYQLNIQFFKLTKTLTKTTPNGSK